ncbi:hypothetical protein [Rhodopseudomonas sp. B29]|uniref:hypothetical protein n=1 Tax=Rhodopseudomonas sp. B29 TaxID=95607 RepID=UPI0003478C9D|nr:hypothetical protein [Rhodopseudomonas sp. B29]
MSEATLILPNMRGGCATANGKVHTLFQLSSRSHRKMARPMAVNEAPAQSSESETGEQDRNT